MRKLLSVLFIAFAFAANGEILKPVKWETEIKPAGAGQYDLIMTAHIDKGWHMYSQNNNPDDGPVPTTFTIPKVSGVTFIGKVKEVTPAIKAHDPNFDLDVQYFEDKAVFSQRVSFKEKPKSITLTVNFETCDNSRCIAPRDEDLVFDFSSITSGSQPETPSKSDLKDQKKGGKGSSSMFTPEQPDKSGVSAATAEGVVKPVKWDYALKQISQNQYELQLTADIQQGYHIYGLDQVKDGPVATSISFDHPEDVKIIKQASSDVQPVTEHDKYLNLDLAKYTGKVVFTEQIELLKPAENITGTITLQACDNEKCLAPQKEAFSIPVSGTFAPVKATGNPSEVKASPDPLFLLFSKGFGWGLIALITPCVYPMIPLTVSFFTKRNEKKQSLGTALLFGLSIILIYVGLGVIISVIFGPQALNSLASNVWVNLAFFIIFMLFAFSFFGAFELTLPSSWTNKADAKSERQGFTGIFFMAFTLALVSFSCTGPFIGNMLVLVSRGNGYVGPIAGMGGFAVAFALPFIVFAAFPVLMHKLPKSGGWLNSVKVVFGFLELALALKFFSAVDLSYHWGILKREYFLAIWIIIAIMLGLYLLGKIRFSHDTPIEHVSIARLLLAIAVFAFGAYMVPGLWGAPVKILGGIAPPYQYNEGFIPGIAVNSTESNTSEPKHEKKYAGLFESPYNLDAYYDYQEALDEARKEGKPLMIDFTGHSCTNCRRMEENVWGDPSVLNQLKNDYVLVSLYVDDKTDLDSKDKYYSKALDSKVTTLGDKWSDLEASRYNTNAQPLYVLLDQNEQLLDQPYSFDADVSKFANYLQKAKEVYEKRKDNNGQTAQK